MSRARPVQIVLLKRLPGIEVSGSLAADARCVNVNRSNLGHWDIVLHQELAARCAYPAAGVTPFSTLKYRARSIFPPLNTTATFLPAMRCRSLSRAASGAAPAPSAT